MLGCARRSVGRVPNVLGCARRLLAQSRAGGCRTCWAVRAVPSGESQGAGERGGGVAEPGGHGGAARSRASMVLECGARAASCDQHGARAARRSRAPRERRKARPGATGETRSQASTARKPQSAPEPYAGAAKRGRTLRESRKAGSNLHAGTAKRGRTLRESRKAGLKLMIQGFSGTLCGSHGLLGRALRLPWTARTRFAARHSRSPGLCGSPRPLGRASRLTPPHREPQAFRNLTTGEQSRRPPREPTAPTPTAA